MDDETDIVVFEAPLVSDLYRQALALRTRFCGVRSG